MPLIRPFKGLRPKQDLAARVVAPPYDVLSSEEARQQARSNSLSFLHVNKPEIDLPVSVSPYHDEVYAKGKENLTRLISDGTLFSDSAPCFYLYRMTMNDHSQTGLVTLTAVDEYHNGIIKKHEHTRPEKVTDRAKHIIALHAQVGPVMSAFHAKPEIEAIFAKVQQNSPEYDFVSEYDVRHELWVIDDADTIRQLVDLFEKLEALYIADGHHRSEAASVVAKQVSGTNGDSPYDWFLNVLFSDKEMTILPYNRVVKDLNGLTPELILQKIRPNFAIAPSALPVEPKKAHMFGLYMDHKWYLLEARIGSYDAKHPSLSLDSEILTRNFLDPVLGIREIRTDKRIDFVGGIRGIEELVRLVDSGEFKLAISMFPVSIKQLFAIADAGEVMPPKSTWFEPKLRDGLVTYLIDRKG